MSLEFISELENKIDYLVGVISGLRAEKDRLANEVNEKNNRIGELETETGCLKIDLDNLRNENSGKQGAIDAAADRIRSMISRLDSVA